MAGTYLTQRTSGPGHSTVSLEEARSPFLFYVQTEPDCLEQKETDPVLVCGWCPEVLLRSVLLPADNGVTTG